MEVNISIINKTKGKIPVLPFVLIKGEILGPSYELSIAFVDKKTSHVLNKKWRGKDKPTNILSYALSKTSGELVICPAVVKKEAKNFDKTYAEFLKFLVIHGMLHLKGMAHGSIMEKAEKKYFQKYDKEHFNRNRHRHSLDQGRGGRIRKGRKKS